MSTYAQYDVAGNVVYAIDARGKPTTFAFDDRFGAPNGNAQANTPPTELAGSSAFALPTLVTNALNETVYTQYDYYLGKPVDVEDVNGVIASYSYSDPLDRLTQWIRAASSADSSQISFAYDPANRMITSTNDLNSYNDNAVKSEIVYDGLGRTKETRLYYVKTMQTYDVMGRAYQVSSPYRSGETEYLTATTYDALGRVAQVTTSDNASVLTVYLGNVTTITDPAAKARRTMLDGLDRLIQVDEDPNGPNLSTTTYTYDILDNLTGVVQGSQSRAFSYDGLSLLRSANKSGKRHHRLRIRWEWQFAAKDRRAGHVHKEPLRRSKPGHFAHLWSDRHDGGDAECDIYVG